MRESGAVDRLPVVQSGPEKESGAVHDASRPKTNARRTSGCIPSLIPGIGSAHCLRLRTNAGLNPGPSDDILGIEQGMDQRDDGEGYRITLNGKSKCCMTTRLPPSAWCTHRSMRTSCRTGRGRSQGKPRSAWDLAAGNSLSRNSAGRPPVRSALAILTEFAEQRFPMDA